ncbi:MAG: hypothetical protein ACKN9U_00220 [Pirellulaceae bacterium]
MAEARHDAMGEPPNPGQKGVLQTSQNGEIFLGQSPREDRQFERKPVGSQEATCLVVCKSMPRVG